MSKPLSLFQQMQIQRDEAIERAEKAEAALDNEKDHSVWADGHIEFLKSELDKAEREVERLSKIATECDGVECVKHDGLVRIAVKERKEAEERAAKYGKALEFYANTENWDETEDPVITSRDPLGSTPYFHIVFLGQDERWPGHPSSAAIEALEPIKKGEAHES